MARKQRRTLAIVANKLEDVVASMQTDAVYFSAYYDNKTHIDFVADKIEEVVKHYDKIVGWWQIKKINDEDYKLGVVVYANEAAAERDRKKGINYERYCF